MMQIERLTDGEETVMKAVWDCKKEPVLSDIHERVTGIYGRDWKPQTVSTFLAKLVRKNYLKLQRTGKIYTYQILIREETYNREELKRLYIYLYKGNKEDLRTDIENL